MSKSISEKVAVMPDDFVVSIKDTLADAEVTHKIDPVDKIRVVLYKGDTVFDSFSFSTKPKSRLLQGLVISIGKIINKRNEKRAE